MSRRGGRPRKAGKREPNGRHSRRISFRQADDEMTEKEAKSVVLEARARQLGLPSDKLDVSDPGEPNAGTPHGLLFLAELIDRDQWAAASWFIGLHQAYLRAIDAPGAFLAIERKPSTATEAEIAEWVNFTVGLYRSTLRRLDELAKRGRFAATAFDYVLIQGRPPTKAMLVDLRLGLDVIDKLLRD